MTEEELKKVPFTFNSHLSMEHEHCTSYVALGGRLGFCDHVPYRDGEPRGRGYRHYMIDGKVYKKKEKFIEALRDFDPDKK